MTEFEAAFEFLKAFAGRAFAAVRRGESPDERDEYRRWCSEIGLGATPERLDLALDLAAAARDYFFCGTERDGWLHADDLKAVPLMALVDGLEARGWRLAFLQGRAGV